MIGERLADLRKDKGWTQKDLAHHLCVKWQTVSYYERGKSEPNDEIKIKIAKLFNISIDYLLGLVGDEISYKRENMVVLPNGYTKQYKSDLLDYMKFLNEKHEVKKK